MGKEAARASQTAFPHCKHASAQLIRPGWMVSRGTIKPGTSASQSAGLFFVLRVASASCEAYPDCANLDNPPPRTLVTIASTGPHQQHAPAPARTTTTCHRKRRSFVFHGVKIGPQWVQRMAPRRSTAMRERHDTTRQRYDITKREAMDRRG